MWRRKRKHEGFKSVENFHAAACLGIFFAKAKLFFLNVWTLHKKTHFLLWLTLIKKVLPRLHKAFLAWYRSPSCVFLLSVFISRFSFWFYFFPLLSLSSLKRSILICITSIILPFSLCFKSLFYFFFYLSFSFSFSSSLVSLSHFLPCWSYLNPFF